jgi:uncharacterized membrane protein
MLLRVALEQQLSRWVDGGLIDRDQAETIARFEQARAGPNFLYAIACLGGLAIAIGLVSIVAANWDAIPGRVKIGFDIALLLGLGQAVATWDRQGRILERDIGILVLYAAVLASIALVGQVYQLGGEIRTALTTWTLLTALVVWRGQSSFLAVLWTIGLYATCCAWLEWIVDPPNEAIALGAGYWAPLVFLIAGRSEAVKERRENFAQVFRSAGWAGVLLLGSAAPYVEYENLGSVGLWIGLIGTLAGTAWVFWQMTGDAGEPSLRWVLVVAVGFAYLPLVIAPERSEVVAALCFILLWVVVAFAAHRSGLASLLNLATALIGLRLIVVYFEIFGSLLGTGIGLVSGGLLTLALVWLWLRQRRQFARELAPEGGQSP